MLTVFIARQHICPSVCLSRAGIVSKRLHISSKSFHHLLGLWAYFSSATTVTKKFPNSVDLESFIATGTLSGGIKYKEFLEIKKFAIFNRSCCLS